LRQHGQGEAAAAQFQAKVLKDVVGDGHAVPRTLYFAYCTKYSMRSQVFFWRNL
jgi:hypothetical protein